MIFDSSRPLRPSAASVDCAWIARAAMPSMTAIVAALAALAAAPANAQSLPNLRFNEIRMTGTLPGCPPAQTFYLELAGTPGLSIDPYWYIVIGRGNTANDSGRVEYIRRFDGQQIAADGRFLMVGSNFCGDLGGRAADWVIPNPPTIFDTENHTHMLVRAFSGSFNIDLDTDNDCVFNIIRWSQLVDSVAFRHDPSIANNCTYAPPEATIGPSPVTGLPPQHAYRCVTQNTWVPGRTRYLHRNNGGLDTPGSLNFGCDAVDVCPGAGDCFFAHLGKGCSIAACCDDVCEIDPFCCISAWDATCVLEAQAICCVFGTFCPDAPELGDCFEVQAGPGCGDLFCAALVCGEIPSCCEVAWDASCAAAAFSICPCGNPLRGECFFAKPFGGCDDCDCCRRVCIIVPSCCSTEWDALCVSLANDRCLRCGEPEAGSCCTPHTNPGCDDEECCTQVCCDDPFCCDASWDLSCALAAIELCDDRCAACGDPGAPSCFAEHGTPGCNDAECCIRTCTVDPWCCAVAWDGLCVQNANFVCAGNDVCLDVGPGVSCAEAHDGVGCSDSGCCSVVCALLPDCCAVAWDKSCAQSALDLCFDGGCGFPGTGPCTVAHGLPGCDFNACCYRVCAIFPVCCEVAWDSTCAETAQSICCGLVESGSCFVANGSPFCKNAQCCETVCLVDPFCCANAWDGVCAAQAIELCQPTCGPGNPPGTRSCFVARLDPGCDDPSVCGDVCTVDPFCCYEVWDALCVQWAAELTTVVGCPSPFSPIFVAHLGTGCSSALCCEAVCSIDSSCCSTLWDAECAGYAEIICVGSLAFPFPPTCPSTGNCFVDHGLVGCEDHACCAAVCALDAACCTVAWDAECVQIAQDQCTAFLPEFCIPSAFSCLFPHASPYCIDAPCSDVVCAVDPSCCEAFWDFECAKLAWTLCYKGSGALVSGSCFIGRALPGCEDWGCAARVCVDDPFCCSVRWDSICADIAQSECRGGACFVARSVPGCHDATVMLAVCEQDPLCCALTGAWDQTCADLAKELFLAPTPDGQAGTCTGPECSPSCGDAEAGSCFTPSLWPSCDDSSCCIDVCANDVFCCDALWDSECVASAKDICAALWLAIVPGKGEFCAGPCFLPKETPFCDDEECCDLVCAADDFCCTVRWDAFCVTQALFSCLECGDAQTGSCCIPGPTPYCNDEQCCETVCVFDPFCCALGGSWDQTCVSIAQQACGSLCIDPECGVAGTGDCCSPNFGPFCDNEACCEAVCDEDPFCCTGQWDQACANQAFVLCTICLAPNCGGAFAGSCFEPNGTPACDDFECCTFVCELLDPFCCETEWDENCAELAIFFCP